MKRIDGVDYLTSADLAKMWDLEHIYTLRNIIYASKGKEGVERFPDPDIPSVHNPTGKGGSTPHMYRYDRFDELDAWWNRYGIPALERMRQKASKVAQIERPEVEPHPEPVKKVSPVADKVLFTSVDLELRIVGNDFPQFQGSHVRVMVTRNDKVEWFFITFEQAQELMALFE